MMGVRLPYQGIAGGTDAGGYSGSTDMVRRYIRSQVEAVYLLKTDRETGLKILSNISLYRTMRFCKKRTTTA